MKKLLVFIPALLLGSKLLAQKVELSVVANGGLFHYTGVSAVKQSFINAPGSDLAYTNNPYGNKNAFSYGGALQAKFITRIGFIAGLQAGYEVLRSKVDIYQPPIEYLGPVLFVYVYPKDLQGHTILQSSFINLTPFIGYRVLNKTYTLDILPGVDIGLGLSSREHGQAKSTSSSTTYTTNVDRGKPKTDVRLRLGLEAGYKRWGVSASYASGKSNYMRGYVGSNPEVYSSLMRFGLSYRLL